MLRFARLKRSHVVLTTLALLLALDLGRSINARVGYAAPVSVWQSSSTDYADLRWPPGVDLPAAAPLGLRIYAQRCAISDRVTIVTSPYHSSTLPGPKGPIGGFERNRLVSSATEPLPS